MTVQTPDGKRHTITVESGSIYDAAMAFLSRSSASFAGNGRLPKVTKETVFGAADLPRDVRAHS